MAWHFVWIGLAWLCAIRFVTNMQYVRGDEVLRLSHVQCFSENNMQVYQTEFVCNGFTFHLSKVLAEGCIKCIAAGEERLVDYVDGYTLFDVKLQTEWKTLSNKCLETHKRAFPGLSLLLLYQRYAVTTEVKYFRKLCEVSDY